MPVTLPMNSWRQAHDHRAYALTGHRQCCLLRSETSIAGVAIVDFGGGCHTRCNDQRSIGPGQCGSHGLDCSKIFSSGNVAPYIGEVVVMRSMDGREFLRPTENI